MGSNQSLKKAPKARPETLGHTELHVYLVGDLEAHSQDCTVKQALKLAEIELHVAHRRKNDHEWTCKQQTEMY